MLLITMKRHDFVEFLVFKKLLDIVWNPNQNRNFFVETGTAINCYGSTTPDLYAKKFRSNLGSGARSGTIFPDLTWPKVLDPTGPGPLPQH
jgi:hypothetical protein